VALIAEAGPLFGQRSAREIAARLRALKADAEEPPLPPRELALVDDLLSVRAAPRAALARMRDIAVDLPTLDPALDRLEARLDALKGHGIDLGEVAFEASFGRTTLEYYDGFVFGLVAEGYPELPPVASGGRYDALTRQLGGGREIPAVGGVIRPGLVLGLGGAA
jgi:ATP phosphoribosyltransferase regulatory subunit